MQTRTLLSIEPDEDAADFIRGALSPYGMALKNLTNWEDALTWCKDNLPAAIMVSVEPRKAGYAICNKIKRNPDLRQVPLILTSAEETKETFEQHKKLKLCADEYILKPLRREDFLGKMDKLIGLGKAQAEGIPAPEDAVDGDAARITEDVEVEDLMEVGVAFDADLLQEDAQGDGGEASGLDGGVALDVDYSLSGIPDPSSGAPDLSETFEPVDPDASMPVPDSSVWESVVTQSNDDPRDDPQDDAFSGSPTVAGGELPRSYADIIRASATKGDAVILPDADQAPPSIVIGDEMAPDEDAELVVAPDTSRGDGDDAFRELETRSVTRVNRKDLLALREALNRRDKEILDLRDDIQSKDRHIGESKGRVEEREQVKRDLQTRVVEFEKNLAVANERVTALGQDKERIIEREQDLKARLATMQAETERAHAEVDEVKQSRLAVETRVAEELGRVRDGNTARIEALNLQHQAEMDKLRDTQSQAIEAIEAKGAEKDTEIAALRGDVQAREAELRESREQASSVLQAERDARDAEVELLHDKIEQAQARDQEWDARTKQLEGQIVRVYQKLRDDEKTVDKAKRALAVALTLLDSESAAEGAVLSEVAVDLT
jgi:CheY-like chemotaxis protein